MAAKKQEVTESNQSVFVNIEKIAQSVEQEDVETLVKVIDKEIGDHKLNQEEIAQIQEIMSVDALEAAKWKKVADVLKYISIFAIAENNPEAMKNITEALLGILGLFFPIANTAHGLLTRVPDRLFSALIKIGGFATPEYLIYRGVDFVANRKSEKAKMQAEYDTNAYENMVNLIIVCKNKLLSAEMSKLITAEDDIDDETIVGTKDGTVHTIIWNESAWEAFRDKLTSNDKVLIIGKIKNTMPLTLEQIRFEKFGVKYGWNNNIAAIEAEPKLLSKTKNYDDFLMVINDLQISEKLKKNAKLKFNWVTAGKLAIFPPLLIGDILHEGTAVREQQLLFGLYNFYMQDLAEFLRPKDYCNCCTE